MYLSTTEIHWRREKDTWVILAFTDHLLKVLFAGKQLLSRIVWYSTTERHEGFRRANTDKNIIRHS